MIFLSILFAILPYVAQLASATESMKIPANKNETMNIFPIQQNAPVHEIQKRATGRVNSAYYVNWAIYAGLGNFYPQAIVTKDLTHILYGFADTSASTGAITLTDAWADEQIHFPGDSYSEPGNNLYGCLKQMYLIKLANRNIKVLLSVGGYTYSQNGHFAFVTNPAARTQFVNSAVRLVEDYGFDGIDIDFEYPASAEQGAGFAALFTELRAALNRLQQSKGDATPYEISAAVSAGADNYRYLNVGTMNAALTYWNLMAYDYAGSWLPTVANQANLYPDGYNNVSTKAALDWYRANGATASKIVLGLPLYGRAFENTDGLGHTYNGVGPGTSELGIYSYKTLPLAGARVYENSTSVASYSYDSSKREFVSYDTPGIARTKAQYVANNGLAGTMFWELASDKVGADSLPGVTHSVFGALDSTQNHINYPSSKWDNVRNNMGGKGGGGTPPPPPPGGKCSGVAAWSASVAYTGGQTATYNKHLWTAKWWTQNEAPGSSSGVWADNGAC
ncbi:glycoside hydrolase family 18 and carbohydrate-binding module family 5 protein [Schizophyllum commune H4-8]|uniref:chitinase n=1 Tax=Schizophyllum commune (strain H4-8 / FGSC 9210) TaxID=578458 RepID=D8QJS4_SCHCM|nr:glycoside hydrolase family 18 and carbohydrate-binding module family 5 protein [Schizophyllum commune H4-8]KAI5885531.1 glycoside hydrolase family 18 and carbohydrate-binding module family 5 protein [Schizophyllum commune H4-8]